MRILLPVDGSPFARKMLAYLGAHEELFGAAAEFALIHVQSPIPPRARNAVGKELVDKLHADETAAATKVGTAGDEIAKVAESGKFDLIVMGSHGHGALGALLLGSTAQRVLARCAVPVLLIR